LLNADFRDMLSALSDAQAEFLLVGAYAVAVHGLVRSTVLSRRHLILNKRAVGRPQDLADVARLEALS
jgi:hypothetical protein